MSEVTTQPAPVRKIDLDSRWKHVKVHIAKGDQAKSNADDHYISAGQYLKALKAEHDEGGGMYAEWEALVKEKVGIGKSRASELMQIADGTKTVEQVRERAAESMKQSRARISPQHCGENTLTAKASAESIGRSPAQISPPIGGDRAPDPETGAAIRRAQFPAIEGAEAADNAEQPGAEQPKRLTKKERNELMRTDTELLAKKLIDSAPEIASELHAMLWKFGDHIIYFLEDALDRGLGLNTETDAA